ncbi:hypothetical protein QBC47DRAFT_362768 [Echria macrotheca]|uniref:Uncharacterized protein n=1 Tax=Echria macrotheca TaxID=438768 RepID=A0AAJ0B751_9PEZI|nr:hypothetical protein QBC47DRAFT_362768 [Echria macrotheca]
MIEKSGLTRHHIDEYDVGTDPEELPPLKTSDRESSHNLFIIRSGRHSAVVDIVCSPTRNPVVPWKNYRFDPVEEKETCEARTQEALSSFFTSTKTQLKAADREVKREHREEGREKSSGRGGGSSAKENHKAKDQQTAQNILEKLKAGIEEVLLEELSPKTSANHNAPANSHRDKSPADELSKLATDEGDKLERQLWKKATELEEAGREAAWMHRLMFSTSRRYRRNQKENIIDDPEERAQQKKWELGGKFLNEVVNKLYRYRKALAFAVYRAARKKSLVFSECTNTSSERQADILDAVVNGLRFVPITVSLQSRVVLPPAYLSFKRELE